MKVFDTDLTGRTALVTGSTRGIGYASAVGLADWVAGDDDDYVAIAIEKARDIARLGVLRRSLRARVATSEAGNPERYTRTVEAAYRAMWRQWCRQNI